MVKLAISALTALVLATGGALACSPAEMTVSARAIKGDACAISYTIDPYQKVGLGEAKDLGRGFVAQRTFEGNACGGAISMIVADCKTGEVVILGEAHESLMDPTSLGKMQRLESALKSGGLTLERAKRAAAKQGLKTTKAASLRDKIKMGGKTFDLSCGCKLYY